MPPGPDTHSVDEAQGERTERRLRRIFWFSYCLTALGIIVMLFFAPHWPSLPSIFRHAFPALLLWLLVVTGFGYYSQTRMADRMRELIRQRSFIDEVTSVFNYRYLNLRLAEEAERTRRHGGLTAVIYLDLDGFKQVNDSYGHQVGNVVLEHLATTMQQRVRSCDVLGRIGGDEFLAILPQTDRRQAYVLAERLREAVENYVLEVEDDQVIDWVTVSIGVAAYPVNGETIDNVITAADNAVYEGKKQGGNRVSLSDEFIASDTAGKGIVDRIRGAEEALHG